MIISGIYKIQSKVKPERIYIGSTMDMNHRWDSHIRKLKKGNHHAIKLQRHVNKYGCDDLQFSILIGCDKNDLIQNEQFFLDSLDPYFNSSKKAINHLDFKMPEEIKEKMRQSMLGEKNPNFHRVFSEEHKKRISQSRKGMPAYFKGRHHTDKTKKILSEKRIGRPNPHPGYLISEETREKLSKVLKGRIPWNKGMPMREESRLKLIKSMTGKPHPNRPHKHTEESKKKMSEIKKEYYRKKKELLVTT